MKAKQLEAEIAQHSPCDKLTAYSPRERDDNYCNVIAHLNAQWRVILCRDGIQWVLQRRNGTRHGQPQWEGQSYARTRSGLINACRRKAGDIAPIQMDTLLKLREWGESLESYALYCAESEALAHAVGCQT